MSRAIFIPAVTELPVADITITDDRLRPVDMTAVEVIAQSINEHGLLYPVVVRRLPKGRYDLVDGGHRLAALKHLGEAVAPVRCYEGPAPAIRLLEIDANLARADLSDLDRAIHLAARRREYLAEHPETAQGVAGAKARWDASANSHLHSFVALTEIQTGLPKRKIYKLIEAGDVLDKVTAEHLRSAPRRVFLNDILALGKASPGMRPAIVRAFAAGEVKKLSAALKSRPTPAPKDPVEAALKTLRDAWTRAPMAACRRFVALEFDDLSPLVVDEAEARDASEVADLRDGMTGVAAE